MNLAIRALANTVSACSLVIVLAHGAAAADFAASGPVAMGQSLPDVVMRGLNGPDRHLMSYRGRRLIINVWASWCGPCRAEAASLERFAWSPQGMNYAVIGISTDDDRRAAERWLRQSNATLSQFIDRNIVLEHMLGASSIPLTVLVDERGRVVRKVSGARAWDSAESLNLIDSAFAQPVAPR